MTTSKIILDANIITMTQATAGSDAQAVALDADRILAVGTNQQISALMGSGTEVISLQGKTVLPGFIDTHVHLTQTGLGSLGPSVYDVTSADQVLSVAADAVAQAQRGEPVLIHGCWMNGLDRLITRLDLDRLAPHHPVMIVDVGGHKSAVNSRAWDMLDLPVETPGITTPARGVFTGVLIREANALARYRYYSTIDDAIRVAAQHRAAEMALQVGITTVHALDGGDPDGRGWFPERDVKVLLKEQDDLPVRTVIYFQSTNVQKALDWGLPRIGGCLWVDGSYGEHTAALLEPYADDSTTTGVLYFSDEELHGFVGRAHRAGLQISMHAIGDAAIEQLLGAYERVLQEAPHTDHRHRIEHFSLPTLDQIQRAARLGVAVAMQPNFAALLTGEDSGEFRVAGLRHLGPVRHRRRHPYRRIIDAGILVAGGSDSDPRPMGPLVGVHAVVNHSDEERRLTVLEALCLYTTNAAKIAFEEKEKGTIEVGKLADLVVLGDNPLTADPRALEKIPIELTVVGGKMAYDGRLPQTVRQ
jgi:predicted amidohydrolase YtcJ